MGGRGFPCDLFSREGQRGGGGFHDDSSVATSTLVVTTKLYGNGPSPRPQGGFYALGGSFKFPQGGVQIGRRRIFSVDPGWDQVGNPLNTIIGGDLALSGLRQSGWLKFAKESWFGEVYILSLLPPGFNQDCDKS